MLLALHGLYREGWVEWVTAMTYQAASGAGARNMRELVAQMRAIGDDAAALLDDPASSALEIDRQVRASLDGEVRQKIHAVGNREEPRDERRRGHYAHCGGRRCDAVF